MKLINRILQFKKYMKKIIAGVDEVGRGSLVGPVYAAAVILDEKVDKKKIERLKKIIKKK